MKSLLVILYACLLTTASFAQGTIDVSNGSYAFARTNATVQGGGVGNTPLSGNCPTNAYVSHHTG